MCIYLGLLHNKLKSFLLKNCFSLFFLSSPKLFFILLPLSFKISYLLISFFPKSHHIFGQLFSSDLTFFLKTLGFDSLFADFFETVLRLLFVIVFLVSLEFLVLPVGLGNITFHNIDPCFFYVCLLLLFFICRRFIDLDSSSSRLSFLFFTLIRQLS